MPKSSCCGDIGSGHHLLPICSSWTSPASQFTEIGGMYLIELSSLKTLMCDLLDRVLQGSLSLCSSVTLGSVLKVLHFEPSAVNLSWCFTINFFGRFFLCVHFSTHWLPLLSPLSLSLLTSSHIVVTLQAAESNGIRLYIFLLYSIFWSRFLSWSHIDQARTEREWSS